MSATALGIRLVVRNSLVAYNATPPASTVEAPRFFGPSSSRQLPVVIVAASVTRLTLGAQPLLRSSVCTLSMKCRTTGRSLVVDTTMAMRASGLTSVSSRYTTPSSPMLLIVGENLHDHPLLRMIFSVGRGHARPVRQSI